MSRQVHDGCNAVRRGDGAKRIGPICDQEGQAQTDVRLRWNPPLPRLVLEAKGVTADRVVRIERRVRQDFLVFEISRPSKDGGRHLREDEGGIHGTYEFFFSFLVSEKKL